MKLLSNVSVWGCVKHYSDANCEIKLSTQVLFVLVIMLSFVYLDNQLKYQMYVLRAPSFVCWNTNNITNKDKVTVSKSCRR